MLISNCVIYTVVSILFPIGSYVYTTVCMYVCMYVHMYILHVCIYVCTVCMWNSKCKLCLRVEKEREMAEQKMLSEDPRHKRDPK